FFFFQAEDGIRYLTVTGVQTCALPISRYTRTLPTGPAPQPMDALIAGLEKGLLVTRLWYLRMLEPQTITVTGLTRDGVFLVENGDRKSTRLNSSHSQISYAVFCLKKKK